jgi:hypothetical protein
MSDEYPDVPADRLRADGWERRSRTERTLFRTPAMTVTGRTVLYDDPALREALVAAGVNPREADSNREGATADDSANSGAEGNGAGDTSRFLQGDGNPWRFFFATALSFRPPLAPGVGTASVLPMVTTEAKRQFASELEARGFAAVERGTGQRMRTDVGDRVRLTKYTADLPVSTADGTDIELGIEGWLGVWSAGGSVRIAGGAYPVSGVDGLIADGVIDTTGSRDELIGYIRAVA